MHIIYMHLQISCVKIDRSQFVSEGTKWLLQPRSLADLDVKILEERSYSHQRIWGCEGHTRRVALKGVEHRSQKSTRKHHLASLRSKCSLQVKLSYHIAPECTIQTHCFQKFFAVPKKSPSLFSHFQGKVAYLTPLLVK